MTLNRQIAETRREQADVLEREATAHQRTEV
jgi:hypothetical protein